MKKTSIKLSDNQIKLLFCRILYETIIDIRSDAYRKKDKYIYGKADLIHNLPHALKPDLEGNQSESERLQSSFEWFSMHLNHAGFHHKYINRIILEIIENPG